jgi:ABC-type transport system substrate-binding protein
VATGGGEPGLNFLSSAQIPSPANRWRGNNRGGWNSSEYDRLWDRFQTTLDRGERNRIAVQMMRLATEEVAMLFVFHSPNVTAHWGGLRGPEIGAPDTLVNWNIHEWELR